MNWSPHVTVAAIIEQQSRYLLVEEETDDGVRLNQPAGHLEEGESLLQAVIRETREETAHRFLPLSLVGIYRWQVPPCGRTYLRFCFAGESSGFEADRPLDQGILRRLWLDREELEQRRSSLRSPLVLRCIDDYLSGQRHSLELLHELA